MEWGGDHKARSPPPPQDVEAVNSDWGKETLSMPELLERRPWYHKLPRLNSLVHRLRGIFTFFCHWFPTWVGQAYVYVSPCPRQNVHTMPAQTNFISGCKQPPSGDMVTTEFAWSPGTRTMFSTSKSCETTRATTSCGLRSSHP